MGTSCKVIQDSGFTALLWKTILLRYSIQVSSKHGTKNISSPGAKKLNTYN